MKSPGADVMDAESLRSLLPHVPPVAAGHDDPIVIDVFATPVGPMVAGATSAGVCLLEFHDRRALATELAELPRRLERSVVTTSGSPPPALAHLALELSAYFEGRLREFTVPLLMPGTPFEREVWAALLRIPFGKTCSYGELAEGLGKPGAQRAVGRANGRNRIAIVVPCHRVIESTGALRGYGGGLERKRFLLDHERAVAGGTPGLFD